MLQRFALEVLHHEVVEPVMRTDVMEGADVRMVQARDEPGFAVEALAAFRVVREMLGKHLDGDQPPESCIERPIDLAHSPGRNQALDFVAVERTTDEACSSLRRLRFRPEQSKPGGTPIGAFQERRGLRLVLQERFDFPTELLISATGVLQERSTVAGRTRKRGVVEPLDLGPPFRRHSRPSIWRRSHTLARAQSRITVTGEIPSTAAVSLTLSPPK